MDSVSDNYHFRDLWPAGPWDHEADRWLWRSRGFRCHAQRNLMGALCGYVAVRPGHPWHGRGYRELGDDVDVHGGLTFSSPNDGIRYAPSRGERADAWWFGFDCLHSGDLVPSMVVVEELVRTTFPNPGLPTKGGGGGARRGRRHHPPRCLP